MVLKNGMNYEIETDKGGLIQEEVASVVLSR